MYQPEEENNNRAEELHTESEKRLAEDERLAEADGRNDLLLLSVRSDITGFLSKPYESQRKTTIGYSVCVGKDGFYAVSESFAKPRFLGSKKAEVIAGLDDLNKLGFSPVSSDVVSLEEGLRQYNLEQ